VATAVFRRAAREAGRAVIALRKKFREFPGMKKPTREEKERMCTGKRRYRTQGDALDAAMLAGVERQRKAYLCSICGHWHLTSAK
jgi:hypothetical protein